MKDETHKLPPCKNENYKPIFATISTEHGFILRCDKSGKCKHAWMQVITNLARKMDIKDVMDVFHGIQCENGYAGHQSCFQEWNKLMKIKLDKEAKKCL